MFDTLIVQPIFNLLVFIYAIIPGHNFGLAIILFTIVVRMMLWPLVKKQLHHAKAMRALQPEMKKIKKAAKGDRQKESRLLMELYKERQINPFSSIGIIIVQIPILFGLYLGIKKIVDDKNQIIEFIYPFVRDLPWMQELAADPSKFDETLFGIVDLTRKALDNGVIYWPALLLVIGGAIAQYFQSKMLMPKDKDARSLRQILKEAGKGNPADQSEVNAAVGRGVVYIIPVLVLVFTINFAAALPLYWLTAAVVAIIQQHIILREDVEEMQNKDALKYAPDATGFGVGDSSLTDVVASGASKAANSAVSRKNKTKTKKARKNKRRRR